MSNYAFTGILDKLPHRWPNFTTGEKRLVTVLRYKSLLVTLYFFYPSNFSSISPLPPPLSSSSLHPPSRSFDSLPRQSRARAKKNCVALSKPIFLFFLPFFLEGKEEEERKRRNDIPSLPIKKIA